jgi:hypothetical protein
LKSSSDEEYDSPQTKSDTAYGPDVIKDEKKRQAVLATFLRVYGVASLVLFGALITGFLLQTPLLAEPTSAGPDGPLNWLIWNGVRCGAEPCHVPPMLFAIYLVWAVFLLLAAREPDAHWSFLSFTIWANLAHGLLMAVQAGMAMDRYWSKWFTDIPFVLVLAFGIYLLRPQSPRAGREDSVAQSWTHDR